MELYRLWHFSLVPSFHFDYFQHKVVSLSSNKQLMAHLARIRRVYKGEEKWDDTEQAAGATAQTASVPGTEPARQEEEA